ncbi:MAG: hypothetical protein ACXAEU_11520 [Candidatus Hodarchaeales archaeon]
MMNGTTNFRVGRCINCKNFEFSKRTCSKSIIESPVELVEAIKLRKCPEVVKATSKYAWKWKFGMFLAEDVDYIKIGIIASLIFFVPLILALLLKDVIVIREILILFSLLLYASGLLDDVRCYKVDVELRKLPVKRNYIIKISKEFLILVIPIIVTFLAVYNVIPLLFGIVMNIAGMVLYVPLEIYLKHRLPLGNSFPGISLDMHQVDVQKLVPGVSPRDYPVDRILKEKPFGFISYLLNLKSEYFLGFAVDYLSHYHEEYTISLCRSLVDGYWDEIFPDTLENILLMNHKNYYISAAFILVLKKDDSELIDFLAKFPRKQVPLSIKAMQVITEAITSSHFPQKEFDLRKLFEIVGKDETIDINAWMEAMTGKTFFIPIIEDVISVSDEIATKRLAKIKQVLIVTPS